MKIHGAHWLAFVVLAMTISSCGGGGSDLQDSIDPKLEVSRDFSLIVLDESFLAGSSADFRLEIMETAEEVRVAVEVDNANDLRAAYINLEFDERHLNPVGIDAEGMLGNAADLLSASVTDRPGLAGYGEVLIDPDNAPGFNGSGELAVLRFERRPFSGSRTAATAPSDFRSKTEIFFQDARTMSWYYYSTGDYDQNGFTNISDLTPLGRFFGQEGPFDETTAEGVVDYDDNQEINISDVTGIGIGFGNEVTAYRVYASPEPGDYPVSPTEQSKLTPLFTVPFSAAIGEPNRDRLRFEITLDGLVQDADYWIRPADGQQDGMPSVRFPYDQIPKFYVEFSQIDYEIDNDVQTDSNFGHVTLTHFGEALPHYFNLNVGNEWVVENVPILPIEGVGVEQSVVLDIPLNVQIGSILSEVEYGASLTDSILAAPPALEFTLGLADDTVRVFNGQGTNVSLTAGQAIPDEGTEVDGSNWAVSGQALPNRESAPNEGIPSAIANGLQYLKAANPAEMASVDDALISAGAIGNAIGFVDGSGTPGLNGLATWPVEKDSYLHDLGIPIFTEAVPVDQDYDATITKADLDIAMQALEDGKYVELQGFGHCATVVAIAALVDGNYMIYVQHDTRQGEPGGQIIERITYDPAAPMPVAEGGWGFNGHNLFGFVIESVDLGTLNRGRISISQENYHIDAVSIDNSSFAQLEFSYEQTADPLLYLNMSVNGSHEIRNLPLISGNDGETTTICIPVSLGVADGTDISKVTTGRTLTSAPTATAPVENLPHSVGSSDFRVDSAEDATALLYGTSVAGQIWNISADVDDMVLQPRDLIVNQQAGSKESIPVAISNSLNLMQGLHPDFDPGLDVAIDTLKPAVGWTVSGSPAGIPGNDNAWWNRKKQWMNDRKEFPVQTEFVTNKAEIDTVMDAIRDGKDVELRVPGHTVMVTGVMKLTNGQYIFEIAHDVNQDDDTAGTVMELLRYDPVGNTFSGRGWINGKQFTDGGTNAGMFIIESFSTLNILRTDVQIDGTVIDESNYGELTFHFDASSNLQYFNLVVNGEWKVRNLPIPSLEDPGMDESRTIRFPFSGILPGDPLDLVSYGWLLDTTPISVAPTEEELSIVDPRAFTVGSGEDGVSLLSPTAPASSFDWLPVPVDEFASHSADEVFVQETGPKESAPAAVSNGLKLLRSQYPAVLSGLSMEIADMKPATDWGATGSPVGLPEDPSAWWNYKAEYLLDNQYPILTQVKTRNDFISIIDDISAGRSVQLRVPGHAATVTNVVMLSNEDMIIWLAHDTDQADANSGTTIEPVYFDTSAGSFHGNFWIENRQAATQGNPGAFFFVEEFLNLQLPVPMCLDIASTVPTQNPGVVPHGHSGIGYLVHRKTRQPLAEINFEYFDPGGINPGDEHITWTNGPLGPVLIFNNVGGPQGVGLQLFGSTTDFRFNGLGLRPTQVETQLYNSFQGFTTNPAGICRISLADFSPIDQFNLGPSSVPPSGMPNVFSKFVTVPPPPNDFYIATEQVPNSFLELANFCFQFEISPVSGPS